jgi:hypothetical protein
MAGAFDGAPPKAPAIPRPAPPAERLEKTASRVLAILAPLTDDDKARVLAAAAILLGLETPRP